METPVLGQEALFEAIVEGLVQRDFAIIDGFLRGEETMALRAALQEKYRHGQFKAAGIGAGQQYQHNEAVRGDHIHWLDPQRAHGPEAHFFSCLNALVEYLNNTCYLGIRDMEMHFALYPPSSFYKRHLDVFRQTTARKLSVICYLNTAWEAADGGQLRMYLPDGEGGEKTLDISPEGGRLVCFRSDAIEHEVLPARRERYSITGWLKDTRPLL